jgi:site-specific DNA-methyltransferase (adenine-specific)/adenine-specific DNA-methyltransferase
MVELIWKGKQALEPANLKSSKIPLQHLCTYERFARQSTENLTNPTLNPTPEWHNRLILGDKSAILPALLPEFTGQINLIYIDPPFMTGRDFKNGDQLAYSDKWDNSLDIYLQWLYETFMLLKLLLSHNGSLYVHLDWRVTHYAKVILDEVFGANSRIDGPGFKNEIIWHYQSGGRSQKRYARKHDTILFYSNSAHYCFHGERVAERRGTKKRNHMKKWVDTEGHTHWTIHSAGRLYSYGEDSPMTPADVWSDISHLHQKDPERNGYATQKPTALLERIILASSEENDLVLDCFCGSGVTPAVAERLNRRWIACDQSELALHLTRERMLSYDWVRPFVIQRLENHTT